jgi:hypothetical protein
MVKAMKGYNSRLDKVDDYRKELKIWSDIAAGKTNEAVKQIEKAKDLPKEQKGRLWLAVGDSTNAAKVAKDLARSVNQAPDLALATYLYWQAGEKKDATKHFGKLRTISSRFDLNTPISRGSHP